MSFCQTRCMDGFVEKLEVVIRKYMLDAMPSSVRSGLEPLSLSNLTIQYVSWRARLIPARPRKCHRSAEFASSPKATEHQAEVDAITAKIRAGEDLTPHLSKGIDKPVRDDSMMADWRIHHLHLFDCSLKTTGSRSGRGTCRLPRSTPMTRI